MCSLGSGLTVEESFELYCGDGEQVLQWLGYAACSRLAYIRGVPSCSIAARSQMSRSTEITHNNMKKHSYILSFNVYSTKSGANLTWQ